MSFFIISHNFSLLIIIIGDIIIVNKKDVMFIKDLFKEKKTVYSFEIFPPKPTSGIASIYQTLEKLQGLKPHYISITYGTQDGTDSGTLELAKTVKDVYGITPLAHLTAIHSGKEHVGRYLKGFEKAGIENVLALRGDIKSGLPVSQDFKYASDLTKFIVSRGNFSVSGACYPEGHYQSKSAEDDIANLKIKVDSGVSHLNSQLFFDNEDFYRFLDRAAAAGINVPIQAGVMPLVRSSQIQRIVSLTGVKIPAAISRMQAKFSNDAQALFDAGIAYATQQICDLIGYGVNGIHLYIMNNAEVAAKITENIKSLLDI